MSGRLVIGGNIYNKISIPEGLPLPKKRLTNKQLTLSNILFLKSLGYHVNVRHLPKAKL